MSYFGLPALGTEVEVTTRWRDHYYFRDSDYREYHYTGRVVAGNKGMSQGSFAIKDSQGEYREISLDHVVYLRYKGGRVVRAGKTETAKPVADVRVAEGSRGNRYIVTKYQGKITCTCPGATYHGYCKHTKIFDKLAKAN